MDRFRPSEQGNVKVTLIWLLGLATAASACSDPVAPGTPSGNLPKPPGGVAADVIPPKNLSTQSATYISSDAVNNNYGTHDTVLTAKTKKGLARGLISFPQTDLSDSLGA